MEQRHKPGSRPAALVTGASGFIGRHLVNELIARGFLVRALTRSAIRLDGSWAAGRVEVFSADLTDASSLKCLCHGITHVYHLAGHAHAESDPGGKDAVMHRMVTIEGTENLLREAKEAGVGKVVFFSSVKAMGEGTSTMLDELNSPDPATFYGQAKLQAERLISEFAAKTGAGTCSLRLPIVYGAGSKGNLPRMIAAIDRNRFPPLPEVGNKRSMVHVKDVVQAALLAAGSGQGAAKTYIVTDGRAYSTRQIYVWICRALGRPIPGWTVPIWALRGVARMGDQIGRLRGRRFMFDSQALDKLIGSAWYSTNSIMKELGYRPARDLESSLPEMVEEYRGTS